MVFENLTLVELHLEQARIGPAIGEEADEDPSAEVAQPSADGGRRAGGFLVTMLVLAGLGYVARHYLTRDGGNDAGAVEELTIGPTAEQ